MSKECRLVYHAMPRIINADPVKLQNCYNFDDLIDTTNSCESCKEIRESASDKCFTSEKNGKEQQRGDVNYKLLRKFMACTRVNMNVRQVLPPGGKAIKDFERPLCPSSVKGCGQEET